MSQAISHALPARWVFYTFPSRLHCCRDVIQISLKFFFNEKLNIVQTWIVGRSLSREDQMKAPEGTRFILFLPFPLPNVRDDCTYEIVPAMSVPKNLENLHACEVSSVFCKIYVCALALSYGIC